MGKDLTLEQVLSQTLGYRLWKEWGTPLQPGQDRNEHTRMLFETWKEGAASAAQLLDLERWRAVFGTQGRATPQDREDFALYLTRALRVVLGQGRPSVASLRALVDALERAGEHVES
jgi:hypothetical protein